jgi:ABC-2 type transport system permease protein
MNARHIGIIAKKELKGLYNEKTIVLAVALQIFVALFSSFLMVGLATMYNPDTLSQYSPYQYTVAYSGNDSYLQDLLDAHGDFVVYGMDLSTGVANLKERKVSAVLFHSSTGAESSDPVRLTVYTIQNDLQASVVQAKLKPVLLEYEAYLRELRSDRLDQAPLHLEIPVTGTGGMYEFVYGVLIPLLLFMPAIISGALIIDLITEEFQHNTLETLMATPVTFQEMVWGKVTAAMLLVPVQAGAWILLLWANGIGIAHAGGVLLHVTLAAAVMVLTGALIGITYRERSSAQFLFSLALVIFLLITLSIPGNPINQVVRLSVDTASFHHWLVAGLLALAACILAYGTTWYSARYH